MEQTDGNHKKKCNPSELPSCFMTPESPGDQHFGRMTPNFDTSPSSCFLTPPCSQEKVFSPKRHSLDLEGLPKLDFELEDGDRERSVQKSVLRSPLLPEDRIIGRLYIGEERVDFISDLMAVNGHEICQRICSYLEPQDLCRFASVCSKWRIFVKQEIKVQNKWRGFLEECKQHFALKGKENRGSSPHLRTTSCDNLTRLPLKSINLNKVHESHKLDKTASEGATTELQTCSHPASRQTLVDFRPCPKCTSPSNLPKTKEGHCQCQKCGLRFCSVCLRETEQHTGGNQCNGLAVTPSARTDRRLRSRKPSKDIVGSKKCKERVRRL